MKAFLPGKRSATFICIGALALGAFFVAAFAPGQQTWTPDKKGSYGKITRQALERLMDSAGKLQNGDRNGALALLKGMQSDVAVLSNATAFFREQANREFDRCTANLKYLDNRVAELDTQQSQLKAKIDAVESQLAGIEVKKNLAAAEIQRLNASISAAQQAFKEREQKLEELRKWWWVPFYGQYLAIRTLVDNDIGNYNKLRSTLADEAQKLNANQQAFNVAQRMKATLDAELKLMNDTHKGLDELKTGAQTQLGYVKETAVFLTDALVFWSMLNSAVTADVGQSVKSANDILKLQLLLQKENDPPLFNAPQKRPLVDVYQTLLTFADTLDQGNNFLQAEGSDFCGGPPRSRTGPDVSRKCNIEQFTQYYEIVDPKTCAFRYLNPPGCPPRPRTPVVTDQTIAAARQRGSWVRATDQNWIGRSRCESPMVMYYGKLNSPDDCEHACMSSANCSAWTYNTNNGYIAGTTGECWGGTAGLPLNKTLWDGFTSGGVTAK